MSYKKQIICLANSRKKSGSCIAGLEIRGKQIGAWIRPVSQRQYEEISTADMKLTDNSEPKLLDILEIKLLEPRPKSCQTENHLTDEKSPWVKIGRFDLTQLPRLCTFPNPLWINGSHSYKGVNNRIPEDQTHTLDSSLVLVEPQSLVIEVGSGLRKKQVRAEFKLAGGFYKLTVTDPVVEQKFLSKEEGRYNYKKRAVLCVSIGEVFNGYRYKLVASIIDL